MLGIILSFSLGPVFFELINTSLRKGFKSALFLEFGVIMSDVIYLIVALFSAEKMLELIKKNDEYFTVIGGGIFIIFGIVSILKNIIKKKGKNPKIKKEDIKVIDETILDKENNLEESQIEITKNVKAPKYIGQILKGITLNAINPSVLLFWIATCSFTIKELEGTGIGVITFFIITLLVMFGIDLLKIHFASKLKRHMTPKILTFIGVCIGLIMVGAGIFIMFFLELKSKI